jgi:hypothetical protein
MIWLLGGGGGRWAMGAESYDRKKAWSSINHSIFYIQMSLNRCDLLNAKIFTELLISFFCISQVSLDLD